MNHEPECPMAAWLAAQPTHDPREPMCFCNIIRAAYQRGREDAARDVRSLAEQEIGPRLGELINIDRRTWHLAIEFAARAAEGK